MNAVEVLRRWVLDDLLLAEPAQAGALTLIPVTSAKPHRLSYLTYAEAPEHASITEVSPGGSVGELLVQNSLDVPLMLIEGEVLVGLKQNRVLNTTVMVAANSQTTIPVACVEARRWNASSARASRDAYHLSPRIRATKNASVNASMRARGSFVADQSAVWSGVDERFSAHGMGERSAAYSRIGEARRREVEAMLDSVRPSEQQIGVMAAIGGRIIGIDVFDQPRTFAAVWRSLVGSYATDALVEKVEGAPAGVDECLSFLAKIADAQASVHSGVAMGEQVALIDASAQGTGLVVDGAVVHLAVHPREETPRGRGSWFGNR